MQTINCQQCGLSNISSAMGCAKCGAPLTFSEDRSDDRAESELDNSLFEYTSSSSADPGRTDDQFSYYFDSVQNANLKRREKRKALAYWSIGLGIAGMPLLWILFGAYVHWSYDRQFGLVELVSSVIVIMALLLGGLGLGILAFRRGMLDPKNYAPRRVAIPGIVISGIGLFLFPLAVSLAVPGFLSARRAANEEAAILKIKRIAGAQQVYMKSVVEGQCGDIEVMPGLTLLDLDTARTESDGYRFYIKRLDEGGCEIHGVPSSASEGDHSFYYSTTDNQLRSGLRYGAPAGRQDPLIGKPARVAQTLNEPARRP